MSVLSSPVRFLLYDDGETLGRKAALAERLGISKGLLLIPEEWSEAELIQAEKNPAIQG